MTSGPPSFWLHMVESMLIGAELAEKGIARTA